MQRFTAVSSVAITEPDNDGWLDVVEPATGQVWAQAAEATREDVDRVVAAARNAYETTWQAVDASARGRLLHAWADLIERDAEELATTDSRDTGNLLAEARGDVAAAVNWLRYYAGMADKLEGRTPPAGPDRVVYTVREPFGVVVGISSYNSNTLNFAWKAAPALAAGNTFVMKAPEVSPAATMQMGRLATEAGIPEGVVHVLTGRGQVTGSALAAHPDVGFLSFTGSAGTAEAIAHDAASTLKPLAFELGGKNAAIALRDVNAELFVPSILHSNFVKSGQSCATGSRVYVHASRYEEIADRLATEAAAIRVGLPHAEDSQMGSLITTAHRDRIHAFVERGVTAGASVRAGGGPVETDELASGAFYQPTIVTELSDENPLVQQELFGPVVGVMPFDELDEVAARANALDYGLTAQVWGDGAREIQQLTKRLEAGTVWVNMYRGVHWTAPYGGYKRSGYGRENGFEGIEMYTRLKTVMWDLSSERPLPYSP